MSEQPEETTNLPRPEFPTGRVKKIMKLDNEVKKTTSEALFLVTKSTELFVRFLAEKSAEVSLEKKRRTVKLEHVRIAVKRHQPTSDFLLDSLPVPDQSHGKTVTDEARPRRGGEKSVIVGTRRIDSFFAKSKNEDVQMNEA